MQSYSHENLVQIRATAQGNILPRLKPIVFTVSRDWKSLVNIPTMHDRGAHYDVLEELTHSCVDCSVSLLCLCNVFVPVISFGILMTYLPCVKAQHFIQWIIKLFSLGLVESCF